MPGWGDLGAALRRLRSAKGLTQDEVARRMGLANGSAASRLESSDANPRWENVARYLEAIDCSPRELVEALKASGYDETDRAAAALEVREKADDELRSKVAAFKRALDDVVSEIERKRP